MSEPDEAAPIRNPMAAQWERTRFVNILVAGLLVLVAWQSWPTESRKLQKRADAYTRAVNSRDWPAAYAFLSAAAQRRVPLEAWRGEAAKTRAPLEVGTVQVDEGGTRAAVLLSGTRTQWVRQDGVWHLEADR